MTGKAFLSRDEGAGNKATVWLDRRVFRIGRLDENDLVLDNPYISRYHAEIIRESDSYLLHDLDSTSGTFVNDEKVDERRLKQGDRLRLGQGHGIEFVFHAMSAEEQRAATGETTFQPVRIIAPEEARFINTSMLPPVSELRPETIDRLRELYQFTSELHSVATQHELTEKLATFLHRTLQAQRCAVLLYDREHDSLYTAATCPADCEAEVTPSFGIARRILDDNIAVISLDAVNDERFSSRDSVKLQSIHAVMCAPIGSKTRVWGVCYVDHLTPERAFDEESLEFMIAVARQAGLTLENLFLLDEQRRSVESFIRTLAASIGARDDSTAGHSARVGAYASGTAKTMGLGDTDCRLIYYAGLLHDYGKIGTRDDVLLKPAELTREEYEHVKEHPLHTFRILSKMRFPEELASIPMVAAAHHERWDGSGYPHGLKGEEIPLGSRIVAVADTYDAIAEQRVYHEAVDPESSFNEILMRSGTYFDPTVVEAFGQYFHREIMPRRRMRETLKRK